MGRETALTRLVGVWSHRALQVMDEPLRGALFFLGVALAACSDGGANTASTTRDSGIDATEVHHNYRDGGHPDASPVHVREAGHEASPTDARADGADTGSD